MIYFINVNFWIIKNKKIILLPILIIILSSCLNKDNEILIPDNKEYNININSDTNNNNNSNFSLFEDIQYKDNYVGELFNSKFICEKSFEDVINDNILYCHKDNLLIDKEIKLNWDIKKENYKNLSNFSIWNLWVYKFLEKTNMDDFNFNFKLLDKLEEDFYLTKEKWLYSLFPLIFDNQNNTISLENIDIKDEHFIFNISNLDFYFNLNKIKLNPKLKIYFVDNYNINDNFIPKKILSWFSIDWIWDCNDWCEIDYNNLINKNIITRFSIKELNENLHFKIIISTIPIDDFWKKWKLKFFNEKISKNFKFCIFSKL